MKTVKIKKMILGVICVVNISIALTTVAVKAYNVGGDNIIRLNSWSIDNGNDSRDLWTQSIDGYIPEKVKGRMVTGDFDGNGRDEIAAFYDYGIEDTAIHLFSFDESYNVNTSTPWHVKTFDANAITDKVVSGDFDGDGKDEILAMYKYSNSEMGLFLFKANSNATSFEGKKVFSHNNFNANNVVDVVAGDFDGDGKYEAAVVYDYGNAHTAIFEYRQASTDTFTGKNVWENNGGFNGNSVKNKVVAGDFLGDGKDEIVMFYDYGNTETSAWVFSNNNGQYTPENKWTSLKFNGNSITDKVAATRYKGQQKDKIVSLYDYGNNTTGIIKWTQDGNQLKSSVEKEYTGNYEAERTNGRVVVGKFNGEISKFAAMYDGSLVQPELTDQQKIVNETLKHLGKTYVWGATGPNTFDCSGFTQYVYRQALGIDITRTTYTQVNQGIEVSANALQPGDLIFPHAGHVQIYIGNGQVIHAPQTGDVVKIAPIGNVWHARRIIY